MKGEWGRGLCRICIYAMRYPPKKGCETRVDIQPEKRRKKGGGVTMGTNVEYHPDTRTIEREREQRDTVKYSKMYEDRISQLCCKINKNSYLYVRRHSCVAHRHILVVLRLQQQSDQKQCQSNHQVVR